LEARKFSRISGILNRKLSLPTKLYSIFKWSFQ